MASDDLLRSASIQTHKIRPADEADYAAIGQLMYDVIAGEQYGEMSQPMTAQEVGERWAAHGVVLVAVDFDNTVLGTITLAIAPSRLVELAREGEAEIRLLAVAQHARHCGIARSLVSRAIDEARRQKKRSVVLSTQSVMTAAQALYASLGFHRESALDRSENERHFLAFRKDL